MFNQQFYPGYMPNSNIYGIQPPSQVMTPPQPQISFVQAKSMDELSKYRVMPNVSYMGINSDNKEIYVRRMNNDGNIETETYSLKSEQKEKSQLEIISDRITNIENILKEKKDEQHNGYVNQQSNQQQTQYNAPVPTTQANVRTNDGW